MNWKLIKDLVELYIMEKCKDKNSINLWRKRPRYNQNGWRSRGYLPHCDKVNTTQFVTIRLADSLPITAITRMQERTLLYDHSIENKLKLQHEINQLLDQGYGECFLKDQKIASMVVEALKFNHGKKYILHEWVIMPNHVHLLLTTENENLLLNIIKSFKGYTGSEANKILNRKGQFWYREYYDRYIRNEVHYENARYYIYDNPVMAGLCSDRKDWAYSSYNFRT
jgi:putative transposase